MTTLTETQRTTIAALADLARDDDPEIREAFVTADEHREIVEWLVDLSEAVMEAAGLSAPEAAPITDSERARVMGSLTADDLVALVQGRDLPRDHPFLLSIRATAAA
jgi:hypothetical protein